MTRSSPPVPPSAPEVASPSEAASEAADAAGWVRADGAWWLLASRCERCDNRAFPATDVCHVCGASGTTALHRIAPRGRVYSRTRIHAAPAEFPTPYRLAYVDLDDGPRVLGRLPEEDTPAIGEAVTGAPAVVGATAEGSPLTAPLFSRQEA
ncbi:Zn-ribbon domain-containing OB-fold protein [Streptomyces sp. 4N509B]|uniref:Zn-ribbon domain-containing OB-fold protein n=1 Tax=Streptomyces sp. 4N509B TaxID=3457413 RepID=UPI003FD4DAB4